MNRAEAVGALVLVVLALYALMWQGWRRRGRRDADLPELPDLPDLPTAPGTDGEVRWGPADATYVSTTVTGDWLDRVVARGLGTRSTAEVTVLERGVVLRRRGAVDLFVPRTALRGARLEPGQAGKFVGGEGLVVLDWVLGERALSSAVRLRDKDSGAGLVTVLSGMADGKVA